MDEEILISDGWEETQDGFWICNDSFMKPVPLSSAIQLNRLINEWSDLAEEEAGENDTNSPLSDGGSNE